MHQFRCLIYLCPGNFVVRKQLVDNISSSITAFLSVTEKSLSLYLFVRFSNTIEMQSC